MTAQLEEAELPVVENDDTGVLVTPEEDTATSTEEIIAEEEQIDLYCQSLSAMMEEIYCINDTITLYGDSGARMASRLFPNAPVDMLVTGQEGFKEILKSIWGHICKLWKKVVGFLSKVLLRIFIGRNAADVWEKNKDAWFKAFSYAQRYSKHDYFSDGHGRGSSSNSSSTGDSIVIEVYDPKEVNRYAKDLQGRLNDKFSLENLQDPVQQVLKLLKSNNPSSDDVLKEVEKLHATVHARLESAKSEKSINAEALRKIKKTRFVLTSATLQQLNNDLQPLIKTQKRIEGWQKDCRQIISIGNEIGDRAYKLACAPGSDEEVKTARSIASVSLETVRMLLTIVSQVRNTFMNVDSIINSYIIPIRVIANRIAKRSGQTFQT